MTLAPLSFDWVERQTAGAVRQGVALETLLERSLIERRHGDRRDIVSPVQHVLLCMNTVLALEDAAHGMARSGVGLSYPAIGLRLALGSPHLEAAIQTLAKLYARASEAVHIRLTTEHEWATLSVHMDAIEARDIAYLEENYLVWTFIQLLRFLGRAPAIGQVTLRDPFHFSLGAPHWAMGGMVRHGEVTSFRFPRRLLGARGVPRGGDNPMWEAHQLWLGFMTRMHAAPEHFVRASDFVRFSDLVEASGKSANTVRRRYQASGGLFRDARRRALVDAASSRLAHTDDKVETIAADLGYADARSFRRFVKTATGFTPQQIRDRKGVGSTEQERGALSVLEALCLRMDL